MAFDVEVRWFRNGARVALHPDDVLGATWELIEGGGLGQWTVTCAREFDDIGFVPQGGDIVEFWALGSGESVPRGRGIVSSPERMLELKESRQIGGYGRMADLNTVLLDKIIVHPGGADLSAFAAEVAKDYAARRGLEMGVDGTVTDSAAPLGYGRFVTDLQTVNVSLEMLTLGNTTARDAMDEITSQSGGNAVWGWDIDPASGYDRFYLRPRVAQTAHQFYVGANVASVSAPLEMQYLRNAIKIQGGPAKFPNLVTNGSFETPSIPDANSGSLLSDGGFEIGSAAPNGWTYVSGASRNSYDGSPHHATAHTGKWYAILDNVNEEIWQEVAVTPATRTYIATLYAARERGTSASQGNLIVEGRNSSGTVTESYSLALAPGSTTWTGGQGTTVLASDGLQLAVVFANAGTAKARVRVVATANVASQAGLLIDDVAFYDSTAAGQVGWSTHVQNPSSSSNRFNWIDWRSPQASWEGSYGVRCNVTADPSNKPALAPAPGDATNAGGYHFRPAPQQSLIVGFRAKFDPSAAGNSGLTEGIVHCEYREWASDGHETQFQFQSFTLPANNAWSFCSLDINVHGDAVAATVQCTFASSGTFDIDGFVARDAASGEGASTTDAVVYATSGYLRGTSFERYVRVDDAALSGLSADAAASIAAYGVQEGLVENSAIVDWNADAKVWASAYLNRFAVPIQRPKVELHHEPARIVSPGDGTMVRVSGTASDIPDGWPAKVTYTWARSRLALSIELNNERPTWAKLLKDIGSNGSGSTSSIAAVANAAAGAGTGVGVPAPGAVQVTDGTTTVASAQIIRVSGATVTADGGNTNQADVAIASGLRLQKDTFTVTGLGPYSLTHVPNGLFQLGFTDLGLEPDSSFSVNASAQQVSLVSGVNVVEIGIVTFVYSY